MSFFKLSILSPVSIVIFFGGLGLALNIWLYSDWSLSHTIYVIGIAFFAIFYLITKFSLSITVGASKWRMRPSKFRVVRPSPLLIKFYWFLAILGGVGALYQIFSVGVLGQGGLFFNLRYAHTVEKNPVPFIGHLGLFALVLSVYYVYNGAFKLSILALFLSLLVTLSAAERTGLLLKLSAVLYVYLLVYGVKLKTVFLGASVFLALVSVIAFSAGKSGGIGAEFFLFKYLGYGLTSFDSNVLGIYGVPCYRLVFGNVFGEILNILADSSNYCENVPGADLGFFNVYTYLHGPYVVFGSSGVFVLMAVLGCIYSFLYHFSLSRQGVFIIFSSVFVYPLILIFYDWQFDLSAYVYVALISIPLALKLKKYNFRR